MRFTFHHFYGGGRFRFGIGQLEMILQADYGWIDAKEVDRHLIRGDRLTKDSNGGTCWHLSASVRMALRNSLALRFEGDFKRLLAVDCNHYWNEADGSPVQTWSGSKIWSDQQSVAALAELRF